MSTVSGRRVLSHLADINDADLLGAVEGDMVYRNDVGLWVVVGGNKGVGKAPLGQVDGSVAWQAVGLRTLIDETTLGADQASITFSSIPDTFDLLLMELVKIRDDRAGGASFPSLRVGNGSVDTGSNYNTGGGSDGQNNSNINRAGTSSFELGDTNGRWIPGATATAGVFGYGEIRLVRYTISGSRDILWQGGSLGATGVTFSNGFGQWVTAETDPIDIVELLPEGTNFVTGTQVRLWGIVY